MTKWLPGMQIYLLRHGEAEETAGVPDEERALTPAGRASVREVLLRARMVGVAPSLILTSPLRRAVETAELAAESLGFAPQILHCNSLLPHARPGEVWEDLRGRTEEQVLLAGHDPVLARAAAFPIGAPAAQIDMKKGALARVDLDASGSQPQGILRWLITPDLAAPAPWPRV